MKKQQKPTSRVSTGDLVKDLFSKPVTVDGKRMSAREAMIRALYSRSLAGDIDASLDLQKLRDECRIEEGPIVGGCLVVPEPMPLNEWERLCAEQQAPFRETNYGSGEL